MERKENFICDLLALSLFTSIVFFLYCTYGNDGEIPDYHRSAFSGTPKLEKRYLHADAFIKLQDIGENNNFKKVHFDKKEEFELYQKLFLSFHPDARYILEVRYGCHYFLGKNDFIISIKNRRSGTVEAGKYSQTAFLPQTTFQKEVYNSWGIFGISRCELSCYLDCPVNKMIITNKNGDLTLYWQDANKREWVYHCDFAKDNFVIESRGDFLSTKISYEQKYTYRGSRGDSDYPGWKQEDICFKAFYYQGDKIKPYNWRHPAPQLQQ